MIEGELKVSRPRAEEKAGRRRVIAVPVLKGLSVGYRLVATNDKGSKINFMNLFFQQFFPATFLSEKRLIF